MIYLKYFIFYGSWLVFPVLLVGGYFCFRAKKNPLIKIFSACLIMVCLVFIWARFIERNWLLVRDINLNRGLDKSVILIGDMHLGIYKSETYLQKVVGTINSLESVDLVMIAGDLTYEPIDQTVEGLTRLIGPLRNLKVPVVAVLGNHDVSRPGPVIKSELIEALKRNQVIYLENEFYDVPEMDITILGLGDNWERNDKVELIDQINPDKFSLVLTHNPDTTLKYGFYNLPDLVTMVGHTHCGQIRIPLAYKKVIPADKKFSEGGIYNLGPFGDLVITCGLGEVGLPLRLFNRPEILRVKL